MALPAHEHYSEFLVTAISIYIVAMKNKSFANEKEVRLAIPYDRTDEYGGLRFRTSPIGLIPYICTGDQKGLNGPLPIEEVMVGPSSRQELLADTVRNFLKYKGYSEVEVTLSRVPFRG